MRQSRKRIIGSGLIKAVEAAAKKEDTLRARMMFRDRVWRGRIYKLKDKLVDRLSAIKLLRQENKRLRRAVVYLETVNGRNLTETAYVKQHNKVNKILGIPANQDRSANWHKVSDGVWFK
jgi:hypothetical protein